MRFFQIVRSRSRLRNTRLGGIERSRAPTVAFSTCVRSTSATSSTKRRIRALALARATPDRLFLSRSSCSISDMLGVSRAASAGSASTSRRRIRLTRSASMEPSSGPIPPARAPRSSPGLQPSERSSQPASDCQRASCPAVTVPEPVEKTLSSTFETRAARRTSAARSRPPSPAPAEPESAPDSDSGSGSGSGSGGAIRPSNSAASSGWRCTTESTEASGSSRAVGSPMSSTTARLADSSVACSSGSKRRERSRQYRTCLRLSSGAGSASAPGSCPVISAAAFRLVRAAPPRRR